MITTLSTGESATVERLIEKSQEAFILSIELYNRPTIKYRVEGCAFFLCNAWELMLKAYLIRRDGPSAIYYPDKPNRTLSLDECLRRVLTNRNDPLRQNLERIIELRNTSTHFVVEEYEGIYAPLLQACVENYDAKSRELLGIEISERIPENYLVLSVRRTMTDMDECRARYEPEVVDRMITLNSNVLSSDDLLQNRRYALSYVTELRLTKKKDADLTVRVDSASSTSVAVVKQLINPEDRYPYRTKTVIERVNERLGKEEIVLFFKGEPKERFTHHDFQLFVKVYGMKGDERYSVDTSMSGEQPRYAYSQQAVDLILSTLRQDPERALDRLKAETEKK